MVLFGYEPGSAAYRVYDPVNNHVHVTRDVVFDEGARWDWEGTGGTLDTAPFQVEFHSYPVTGGAMATSAAAEKSGQNPATAGDTAPSSPTAEEPASPIATPIPATLGGTPGSRLTPSPSISASPAAMEQPQPRQPHPMITRARDGIVQPVSKYQDFVMAAEAVMDDEDDRCLAAAEEPASVDAALSEACWRSAMDDELASIRSNGTWEFATLPRGHRAIGLKWVFKVKKGPYGHVIKHKARLVTKGYAQRRGVDFD